MFNLVPINEISNSLEAKRVFRKLNLLNIQEPLSLEIMTYIEELVQLLPNKRSFSHNSFFNDGVYLRELSIPKNTILIGHTHKNSHLFVVLKGKAKIITPYENYIAEQGSITISKPYTKKIGITYEDSSFLNIYKNPDNLDKEEDLINMIIVNREEVKNECRICSSSDNNNSISSLLL
jgi:hypothetical protein